MVMVQVVLQFKMQVKVKWLWSWSNMMSSAMVTFLATIFTQLHRCLVVDMHPQRCRGFKNSNERGNAISVYVSRRF